MSVEGPPSSPSTSVSPSVQEIDENMEYFEISCFVNRYTIFQRQCTRAMRRVAIALSSRALLMTSMW